MITEEINGGILRSIGQNNDRIIYSLPIHTLGALVPFTIGSIAEASVKSSAAEVVMRSHTGIRGITLGTVLDESDRKTRNDYLIVECLRGTDIAAVMAETDPLMTELIRQFQSRPNGCLLKPGAMTAKIPATAPAARPVIRIPGNPVPPLRVVPPAPKPTPAPITPTSRPKDTLGLSAKFKEVGQGILRDTGANDEAMFYILPSNTMDNRLVTYTDPIKARETSTWAASLLTSDVLQVGLGTHVHTDGQPHDFVTITRKPGKDWGPILNTADRLLQSYIRTYSNEGLPLSARLLAKVDRLERLKNKNELMAEFKKQGHNDLMAGIHTAFAIINDEAAVDGGSVIFRRLLPGNIIEFTPMGACNTCDGVPMTVGTGLRFNLDHIVGKGVISKLVPVKP